MKKVFVTILSLAACLVACNKAEKLAPAALDANRPVQFTVSNIYALDTKADAIANGAKVAIYAGAPINADNVSATVTMEAEATSGTLAPTVTNSLLWGVGQTTQATNFLAVYPFESFRPLLGETEAEKYIEYSIASSDDVEYAEKFLAASASQAPGTGETPAKVALEFKHPFAKLVYNIYNTSDDFVSKLEISGIRRTGQLKFSYGTITTTGVANGTDAPVELNANGENSFMTVVMPESEAVNPVVKVTMVSGATYTFQLAEARALAAGKVYTANIDISGSHSTKQSDRTVLGTFTVTDWENENAGGMTLSDSNAADKWWYIQGNIDEVTGTSDTQWQKTIPFKCTGKNSWEVSFYYAGSTNSDNGFKIRHLGTDLNDWGDSWGKDLIIPAENIQENGYEVTGNSVGSANLRINATGKYKIVFNPSSHNFFIYKIVS